MFNKQAIQIITVTICLIAFGAGLGVYSARYYNVATTQRIEGMLWPNPKQLRDFATIDHAGNIFGLDQLRGKWSFLFFGYTHCPDVCPLTLSVLNQVHEQLQNGDVKDNFQMVFVSVDPERDQAPQLTEYVSYYNQEFIGLSGTPAQVQSLAGQIGVMYMVSEKPSAGDYLIDHSASVFLTDPKGRFIAIFSAPHKAESILSRFNRIKSFINKMQS